MKSDITKPLTLSFGQAWGRNELGNRPKRQEPKQSKSSKNITRAYLKVDGTEHACPIERNVEEEEEEAGGAIDAQWNSRGEHAILAAHLLPSPLLFFMDSRSRRLPPSSFFNPLFSSGRSYPSLPVPWASYVGLGRPTTKAASEDSLYLGELN